MSHKNNTSEDKQSKVLLLWNGMVSRQISGGDVQINTFINNSGSRFEVISTQHSKDLIANPQTTHLYVTDNKVAESNHKIVTLYVSRALKSIFYLLRTRRLFKKNRTVLAASPFMCDVLPAFFARAEKRVVVFAHLIPERKATTLASRIRFELAKFEQTLSLLLIKWRFTDVLACNVLLQEEFKKRFPNKNIYVASPGIDTAKIDSVGDQKKNPNLAVFIGRLTTQKGILDLVDVMKNVSAKYPKLRLKIIGDGPHRQLLEDKIKQYKLTSIELLGFIDANKKYKLLKQAQFFLFPSYEEGWGIALAEGLYAGCHSFCYELEHYTSIFAQYPEYIPLGDKEAFGERLLKRYDSGVKKGQIKAMKLHDDNLLAQQLLKKI